MSEIGSYRSNLIGLYCRGTIATSRRSIILKMAWQSGTIRWLTDRSEGTLRYFTSLVQRHTSLTPPLPIRETCCQKSWLLSVSKVASINSIWGKDVPCLVTYLRRYQSINTLHWFPLDHLKWYVSTDDSRFSLALEINHILTSVLRKMMDGLRSNIVPWRDKKMSW